MNDINYKILGQKLIEKHPEIAKELLNKTTLHDVTLIPEIRDLIFNDERLKGLNESRKKEIILAVVLSLFDPDHLEGYKRMRDGLRKNLSNTFKCSPTFISDLSSKVGDLMTIYTDFKDNVKYFAKLISEKYG